MAETNEAAHTEKVLSVGDFGARIEAGLRCILHYVLDGKAPSDNQEEAIEAVVSFAQEKYYQSYLNGKKAHVQEQAQKRKKQQAH